MALQITNIVRSFKVMGDKEFSLPDPNPSFSPEEVMSFYANEYPQLTTATVSGPEIEGKEAVYEFRSNFGKKG